jgi:hypothetical protein
MPSIAFARENVEKLDRLAELLATLSDATYAEPNEPASKASVGAHVRHVLDFCACLAHGAVSGTVDYEHRERERAIEVDRLAALARIDSLRGELLELGARGDRALDVLVVDAGGAEGRGRSSIVRELEAALSHSVHHFAIIALLLRLRGIEAPDDFGVAPSTLRFHRSSGSAR